MQGQEIQEVELVIEQTNAVTVPDAIKVALVTDLKPIATRMEYYERQADMQVGNQAQADAAAEIITAIGVDLKAVKEQEVLSRITDGLHKLHRKWTGLRDMFVTPLDCYRRQLKTTLDSWQEGERNKAAELQRQLQAKADEHARREREKLEKQAAAYKTEEKREEKLQAAAAVLAPTIHIEPPKTGVQFRKVWVATVKDKAAFLAACATRPELVGYVEINTTALQRAKSANAMVEFPGIELHQERR